MRNDGTLTTGEVAELARVTYRQLDYWVRREYLHISSPATPGSGTQRHWTPDEAQRARAFGALLHAGVSPVAIGEAELLVDDHWFAARVGVLTVTGPLP
jgi:DNA-binding transcriptional MerR regulator